MSVMNAPIRGPRVLAGKAVNRPVCLRTRRAGTAALPPSPGAKQNRREEPLIVSCPCHARVKGGPLLSLFSIMGTAGCGGSPARADAR